MENCTAQQRLVGEQRRIVQNVTHRQQRSVAQISAKEVLHDAPRRGTICFSDGTTKGHYAKGQSFGWKHCVAETGVENLQTLQHGFRVVHVAA